MDATRPVALSPGARGIPATALTTRNLFRTRSRSWSEGSASSKNSASSKSSAPVARNKPQRLSGPLYKHGGIEVTREQLVIDGFHYPVIELRNLRIARGARHPITVRAAVITMVVFLGLAATLGLAANPAEVSGGTYAAMGAAFVVPFVLAVLGERLRPRAWELWADHYGITVLLFLTRDERQYGQVTRALLRAKEIARLGAAVDQRDLEPWLSWRRMAVRR